MINHFFPFIVHTPTVVGGQISPIIVRSTDATSELNNHKGR